MKDQERVPQGRTPAARADAGETPVERLEALGVCGILRQLARDGLLIDVRCEMPQCYCFQGRRYFAPEIAADRLVADGRPLPEAEDARRSPNPPTTSGSRTSSATNVTTYGGRRSTRCSRKRMSLEQIAEKLNAENVPTIHGTNRWTAASVRKAFVS
jgi:hypothetical protein